MFLVIVIAILNEYCLLPFLCCFHLYLEEACALLIRKMFTAAVKYGDGPVEQERVESLPNKSI